MADRLYNDDPFQIKDPEGNNIDFYLIATIDLDKNNYCIVRPKIPFEGYPKDQGYVFRIVNDMLEVENDSSTIQKVYNKYLMLLKKK